MKKILVLGLLFVSALSYGQIVYKSQFEVACERMGEVYSVKSQDIGVFSLKNYMIKVKCTCTLNTFESADTNERIQGFSLQIGTGALARTISLNCSEIDDMIRAINKITANGDLKYIARTANLRLRGTQENGVEGMIALDLPADGSTPGDFQFFTGYFIASDELIKLLEGVKAVAD